VQPLIVHVLVCVMLVHVPRHISYHISCHPILLLLLCNLYFLMYEVMLLNLLVRKDSKFTWIYLLRHKSEVYKYFLEFQALVERVFNREIISVQSDWGGEYEHLNSLFRKVGIAHQVFCPHTHQ
jgi:hypothetical protein